MGKQPGPYPARISELRILVLHNRDFDTDQGASAADPDFVSRADVVNAARDVARALVSRGHFVEVRGVDAGDIGELLRRLQADPPDLVFNLCESLAGEARNEVVVPTLLDLLQIPYTGTGALGLGLALRKDQAKRVLQSVGVPTPAGIVLGADDRELEEELRQLGQLGLGYPLMVKPAWEDASVGIAAASVVADEAALRQQVARLRQLHPQPLLVEQYIAGRELYVSLLGNRPPRVLPMHEIDFSLMPGGQPHIVCYEAKWNPAAPEYAGTRPRRAGAVPPALQERIEKAARAAFAALGLADYGRCDVRLSERGVPHVIDVNPNCDLSDGAGFSLAARFSGLDYDELVEYIAACALERNRHAHSEKRSGRPPLQLLDSSGARGGPGGAGGARIEGRAVLSGGGALRHRAHRQRAL